MFHGRLDSFLSSTITLDAQMIWDGLYLVQKIVSQIFTLSDRQVFFSFPLFVDQDSTNILQKVSFILFTTCSISISSTQDCACFVYPIWVFHDKEIWRTSVRLSDRSKVTQNKINFVKNWPQWGWNPQPLDHHSNALPTELGRICWEGDFWSELCLFHAPLHMLDFVHF